jgi:predicted enzyme related to lactoylglutathione lyase
MGERSGYTPGTFCWADLATPDAEGAKAFYGGLLGWEFVDRPAGDEAIYTMCQVRGRDVCALYQAREGQPSAWLQYIAVDSATHEAERIAAKGGTVHQQPFDVMSAGTMAVVADPQGAVFALWQAGESFGAQLVNEPGAMVWNQLNTTDLEAAVAWYADVFGWDIERSLDDYFGIRNQGSLNGGMMTIPAEAGDVPPHWFVSFTVADDAAAMEGVAELGGQVMVPPAPIDVGRFSVLRDPQGVFFGLYAGEVDP